MDRTFKKKPYTISVILTISFVIIIAGTYMDNYTCPMICKLIIDNNNNYAKQYKHKPEESDILQRMGDGLMGDSDKVNINNNINILRNNNNNNVNPRLSSLSPPKTNPLSHITPSTIFHKDFNYIPCNTIDLLLHVYSLWFIIFMCLKWVMYKRAGWHYFMLDYCYFHNFMFIFFIFYIIVRVEVGVVPLREEHVLAFYNGEYDRGSDGVCRFDGVEKKTKYLLSDDNNNNNILDDGDNNNNNNNINNNNKLKSSTIESKTTTNHNVHDNNNINNVNNKNTNNIEKEKTKFLQVIWDLLKETIQNITNLSYIRRLCDAAQAWTYFWFSFLPNIIKIPIEKCLKYNEIPIKINDFLTLWLGPSVITMETRTVIIISNTSSNNNINNNNIIITRALETPSHCFPSHIPTTTTITLNIKPIRDSTANMSNIQKRRLAALFVVFWSGSVGPILGAIIVYKNSLLFHSSDKMTACFLHLAPGIVMMMLLNSAHSASQISFFSGLSASTATTIIDINILSEYMEIPSYIIGHTIFFLLWQVFYHVTFEVFRVNRVYKAKKRCKRQIKQIKAKSLKLSAAGHAVVKEDLADIKEVVMMRLVELELGMTEDDIDDDDVNENIQEKEENNNKKQQKNNINTKNNNNTNNNNINNIKNREEKKKKVLTMFGESGTNPTRRVTAYTYMLQNPPLGKNGAFYKLMTIFGCKPFRTKVMFNVIQYVYHLVFIMIGYIPTYLSVNVFHDCRPVALFIFMFIILAIYNSAMVMDKWISNLLRGSS